MADNIVEYQVAITKTGDGAAAATADFNAIRTAAAGMTTGTSAASGGLRELRETSMLAREGMGALNTAILVGGGTAFPELTRNVLIAREGLLLTRTAAMLFGASIGEVAGVGLAGAIPIIATAVAGWQAYKAGVQEATSENELFSQTQTLIGRNFSALNDALAKGIISPENFMLLDKLLSLGTESALNSAQQKMAVLGISVTQISNYEKLRDLEDTMNARTLDHFGQQGAAAYKLYNERMVEIQKLAAASGTGLTSDEGKKAIAGATAEFNATQSNIANAQQEKNQAALVKQIDEDLFGYQHLLGQERNMSADEEFRYRTDAFKNAVQLGQVSEEQYTAYVLAQMKVRWTAEQQLNTQKAAALQKVCAEQKQLGDLQAKLSEQALTGTQREDAAIDQRYNDELLQIKKLTTALSLNQSQQDQLTNAAVAGWQKQRAAVDTFVGKLGEAKTQVQIF
jgi:hypothetical protein